MLNNEMKASPTGGMTEIIQHHDAVDC